MPTWYIIRHADKEKGDFYNPTLRIQDQPISAKGQIQSQKLAEYFSGLPIATIYISAFQRTRQTIEPTAKSLHLTPILDARLNEIDIGYMNRMSDGEAAQKYPEVFRALKERNADFRFPGGESGEEARQRIISFFAEKMNQHGEAPILLATHEGLIRLTLCHILGLPVYKRWNFSYDFCGIMEITYMPQYQEWQLNRFNQVCL